MHLIIQYTQVGLDRWGPTWIVDQHTFNLSIERKGRQKLMWEQPMHQFINSTTIIVERMKNGVSVGTFNSQLTLRCPWFELSFMECVLLAAAAAAAGERRC